MAVDETRLRDAKVHDEDDASQAGRTVEPHDQHAVVDDLGRDPAGRFVERAEEQRIPGRLPRQTGHRRRRGAPQRVGESVMWRRGSRPGETVVDAELERVADEAGGIAPEVIAPDHLDGFAAPGARIRAGGGELESAGERCSLNEFVRRHGGQGAREAFGREGRRIVRFGFRERSHRRQGDQDRESGDRSGTIARLVTHRHGSFSGCVDEPGNPRAGRADAGFGAGRV